MYIKNIYIESFGPLREKNIGLTRGLNIIEGRNESGKTTVSMFIKFMLYGLSGRSTDGEISERRRYVSWNTGSAAGNMTVVTDSGEYRIERELFAFSDASSAQESVRERVAVIDTATGERVFKDEIPGVALTGIPEKVFMNTVFVMQSGGKVDGDGLAESIENILLSGDESLSTKKAAEKLDKSRKALKYKRGEGGKLYELDRESARLEAKLKEAREKNAEIIELECGVGELRSKVAERRKESEYYGAVSDAYEKLKKKRYLDEARGYLENIGIIDEKLDAFDILGDIGEKSAEIARLSQEIEKTELKLKEIRRHLGEIDRRLPPSMTTEEVEDTKKDISSARRAKRASSALLAAGIVLLVAGAAAASVAAAPIGLLTGMIKYAAIAAGAAGAVLGIILVCIGAAQSRKYKAILTRWEVATPEGLERAVNRLIDDAASRKDPQSEYGVTKRAMEQTEAERWSHLTELRELCAVFCPEDPDIDIFTQNALLTANEAMEEIKELQRRRNELAVKYDMTVAALGADEDAKIELDAAEVLETNEGRAASRLDDAGAAAALKNKRFADGVLPGLHQTLTDRESRLSALRASTADPAVLADELDGVKEQRDALGAKYDALVLALDTLQQAGENLRHSLMPRIVGEASAIMSNFSDGRYKKLGVDRGFSMSFEESGRTFDASYLSGGTLDMAYICLRNALLNVLFSKDAPPTVYDESFSQIDEDRIGRILSLLSASGEAVQSVVFTCRELEANITKGRDGVNVIRL